MFGLEGKKELKPSEKLDFDLEFDLLDAEKKKKLMELINDRINKIKDLLRKGVSQEDVNVLGIIFNGYNSLLKVISRPMPKNK